MAKKDEIDYLVGDYEQAWTHYRHIEDSRVRYLGFFFTVTLGSAAIAVPALGTAASHPLHQLFGAAAYLVVFQSFVFFVFVSVRRFGFVLRHYDVAMEKNRDRRAALIGLRKHNVHDIRFAAVASSPRPFWLYSAQRTAERTLIGFLVVAFCLACTVLGFSLTRGHWAAVAVCAVATASGLLLLLVALGSYASALRRGGRRPRSSPAP